MARMNVAIIDYDSGNLHSAAKSFQRAADEAGLSVTINVTRDPDVVLKSDKIVLPGVGAFAACRAGLLGLEGMVPALEEAVLKVQKPFLGICVGMQLMASRGNEFGEIVPGLDWISGEVMKVTPKDPALKIPHMGWNEVTPHKPHAVLPQQEGVRHAYFVHSFHFVPDDPSHILASVDHGGEIVAAIGRDNIIGVQFHPEKSQTYGLGLITNFLQWTV